MTVVILTMKMMAEQFIADADKAAAAAKTLDTSVKGASKANDEFVASSKRRMSATTQVKVAVEKEIGNIRIQAAEMFKLSSTKREAIKIGLQYAQASQQEAIGLNKASNSATLLATSQERLNNVKTQGVLITTKINTEEARTAGILQRNAIAADRYAASQAKVAAALAKSQSLMASFRSNWYQMAGVGMMIAGGLTAAFGAIIKNTTSATETQNLWVKSIAFGHTKVPEAIADIKLWDAWIQKLTTNTTTSAYKLKSVTARMFNMMRGAGMERGKSEDYTKALVASSLDVGSLYEETPDSVLGKMKSALSRQPRPMKILGVDVSDKALENYAKANNLIKEITGHTEKWKNVASKVKLEVIAMKMANDLKLAKNDMIGTIGQLANAWKVMQTQWYDISIEMGKSILPMMDKLVKWLNDASVATRKWFTDLEPAEKALVTLGLAGAGAFLAMQFPLMMLTMGISALVTLMANPMFAPFIIGLTAAIAVIVIAIRHWKDICDWVEKHRRLLENLIIIVAAITATYLAWNIIIAATTALMWLKQAALNVLIFGMRAYGAAVLGVTIAELAMVGLFPVMIVWAINATNHFEELKDMVLTVAAALTYMSESWTEAINAIQDRRPPKRPQIIGPYKDPAYRDYLQEKANFESSPGGKFERTMKANTEIYYQGVADRDAAKAAGKTMIQFRVEQSKKAIAAQLKGFGIDDTSLKSIEDTIKNGLNGGDVKGAGTTGVTGATGGKGGGVGGGVDKKATESEFTKRLQEAYRLGYKYVWGAAGKGAVDCSGILGYAMKKGHFTSTDKIEHWQRTTLDNLREGDQVMLRMPTTARTGKHKGERFGHTATVGADGYVYEASSSQGHVIKYPVSDLGTKKHYDALFKNPYMQGGKVSTGLDYQSTVAQEQLDELKELVRIADSLKDKVLSMKEYWKNEIAKQIAKEIVELQAKKDKEMAYRTGAQDKYAAYNNPIFLMELKYGEKAKEDAIREAKRSAKTEKYETITNYINIAGQAAGIVGGSGSIVGKAAGLTGLAAGIFKNASPELSAISAGLTLIDTISGLFKKKDRSVKEVTTPVQKVEIVGINKDVAGVLLGISKHNLLSAGAGGIGVNVARLAGRTGAY